MSLSTFKFSVGRSLDPTTDDGDVGNQVSRLIINETEWLNAA